MIFSVISSVLIIISIVCLFGLTPEQVTDDLMRLITPNDTMRDRSRNLRGNKKKHRLYRTLVKMKTALAVTGKSKQFTIVCCASLVLFAAGIILSVLIDNIFLMPVLSVAFALIPFFYTTSTLSYYEKNTKEELETALSIITTSYVRSDDIVAAVRENIKYIKPPLRDVFKSFEGEATAISSNIKRALYKLKSMVDNEIFWEWCDTLIQCQDDRTLKDTLLPIVAKLTDVRIVNSELKTMLSSARNEYWFMVALVVGNIPLLYLLNKDWFHTLLFTTPGKLVCGICGMELQRKESKEFLNDLTTRDQRMMCATVTMAHMADSKEQLDADTETILSTARRHLCQLAVLKFQQTDGLNTVLPIGCKKIQATRTLTTESLAVFMPFKVQEVAHEHGIYYGQNAISNNMIIANRKCLLNGNSFILGVSGSGKSFTGKCEIANLMLAGDSDIIIIDPEREYAPLVKAMGGAIIDISATSKNHINAMDMNSDYGDGEDPLILKSEFILSLCEQLIGSRSLGAQEKSLIDRCAKNVYRNYRKRGYKGKVPTLKDFRADLLKQSEPEAQEIALAIELFTDGSLNTFAKETNVDVNNRLICYDILDLGKQLLPIGMLVVLDSILNRITANRAKGKNTFIIIDEIYLLFQHEYSANFLFTLWKRVRKYGAFCTGITQNVDDLLQSHTARTMLANSEFVIMLNQASTDRIKLAELLNISDTQLSYITNVEAGRGLMKVGSALVPFVNKFPKNTKLYALMTTKFGER